MITDSVARGDGKFFYIEKVPVGVPYQRALLMFENEKETLILQSQYKTVGDEDMNSIAWVVPVPAVPELASMDAKQAKFMFLWLGLRSQPNVFPVVRLSISISIIMLFCFFIAKVLNWLFTKPTKAGAKPLVVSGLHIAIWVVISFVLIAAILMPPLSKSKARVEVVKEKTVGIYDIKVIKGDDAGTVTQWLKDNGFGFKDRLARKLIQIQKEL
jgi:hypothetical protein